MLNEKLVDESKLVKVVSEFKQSKDIDLIKKERKTKEDLFRNYLNKESLESLDEGTLRELIQHLWSFYGWTNKDYLVEEMLKSDLQTIREALAFLIYSEKTLPERFDYVKNNVRMMGSAAISEILTILFSGSCAIWTRRAREGLIYLGVPADKIPNYPQITGKQYEEYCDLAKAVLKEINEHDDEIQDFYDLNSLLFFISNMKDYTETTVLPETDKVEQGDEDFDHDYAIEQIAKLGDGLGFEVKTEHNVAPGCRIDALWKSRIANLGIISYAFEVHRKGSRDSAILNLQKVIKQDPSIQKVVIVSSSKEIEIFKNEISSLGEDFRETVGYLEVRELEKALGYIESLKEILNNAGLLKLSQ